MGGGIYCGRNSNGLIRNNNIAYNTSVNIGGGICCVSSNTIISNNLITNNEASSGGGIAFFDDYYSYLTNNTISNNIASETGGGILIEYFSIAELSNNILWANNAYTSNEIFIEGGSAIISYCDIQDTLWPGEGNISVDPLFRNPENGDFHLMSTNCGDNLDSPCIDAGHPSIEDVWLDCEWGLGTSLSDMGAYGGGDSTLVGIDDDKEPEVPIRFGLSQNYPNPFNALTIIRYSLPSASDVTIRIYDMLGRKVETLVQGERPAGYHQVVWDGKDKDGKMVSTGIYFYELYVDDYRESKAMIMIK